MTIILQQLKLARKFKILWASLFALIWLGTNIYVISQTPQWNEKYIVAFVLGNLCMFIAAAYMIFIYAAAKAVPTLTTEKIASYYKRSLLVLGLALLLVPFFFIIHVPDSAHNWDFFEIFVNTSFLHGQSIAHLPATEDQLYYFLRYPNNQFFGIFYNVLFAPFGMTAKIWLETALSAVLTSVSLLAASLTVRKISSNGLALLFNLVAFGFLPFYVYGAQFYTDTASLPFVMVSLLLMIYAIKSDKLSRQVIFWLLACLLAFIGYNIKPTVLIPMIAVFAFLFINRKFKKLLLMLVLSAIMFVGVHEGVKAVIATEPAFSQQNNNRYNLPLMHWVAMSFAPENKWGGFNPAVLAYSESFPDKAAKQKADLKLFVSNLKKQGLIGVTVQLWRKISYTWFNGDLSDFFYTYHHQNPFLFRYFDWTSFKPDEGNITGWLLIKAAQTLYWLGIVPLMWIEIFLSIFKKYKSEWFIPALAMVGLTTFLLLWEANSRYLYNFAPIMLLLATKGLTDILNRKKLEKQNKRSGDELPE